MVRDNPAARRCFLAPVRELSGSPVAFEPASTTRPASDRDERGAALADPRGSPLEPPGPWTPPSGGGRKPARGPAFPDLALGVDDLLG